MRTLTLTILILLALNGACWAQDSDADTAPIEPANSGTVPAETPAKQLDAKGGGKTFPRYASVKKGDVNVRSGPGNQYPILWVYQRAGYPVQLLTRYDNYFKLRDAEGEEGWVYVGMVSAKKTGLVGGKHPVPLYRKDNSSSDVIARLGPGVVVSLPEEGCGGPICKVSVDGTTGWVQKSVLMMVD